MTLERVCRLVSVAVALFGTSPLASQSSWIVAPRLSLAWWQIDPHFGHLWATTCTGQRGWKPGSARGQGWEVGPGPQDNYSNTSDTIHVPLYPRVAAEPTCPREGIAGKIQVADSSNWTGVRGDISVKVAALKTGFRIRDEYARDVVFQINRYPELRFTIDSIGVASRSADTLNGTVLGSFMVRGVSRPIAAPVRAWPEAGGLRVVAKFRIPAEDLVPVYGFSHMALGLGIGAKMWQFVFAGVDVVLVPAGDGS